MLERRSKNSVGIQKQNPLLIEELSGMTVEGLMHKLSFRDEKYFNR